MVKTWKTNMTFLRVQFRDLYSCFGSSYIHIIQEVYYCSKQLAVVGKNNSK